MIITSFVLLSSRAIRQLAESVAIPTGLQYSCGIPACRQAGLFSRLSRDRNDIVLRLMRNSCILKKIILNLSLIIIFFLLFSLPCKAADYYVSTTGSDTYNGLYETYAGGSNGPWATIRRATLNALAGDTIYVRGGEYPTVQYGYQFLHSGTATQPITLTNYPDEQVIFRITLTTPATGVDGADGHEAFQCWAYKGTPIADYVHVIGTPVSSRTLNNGLSSTKGIVIQGPPGVTNREAGFTITGCSHWEVAGIDFVDLGDAIFTFHYTNDIKTGALLTPEVNSTDFYVHDNRVYNHFRESGMQFNDDHNIIEHNEFYKVDDRYDSPYGCQQLNLLGHGNYVHGNIFSNTGVTRQCTGLLFEWDLSDNNVIDGNTFIDNTSGGITFAGGDNNIVKNNIIYKKTITNPYQAGITIWSYDNRTTWPCDETVGSFRHYVPPNDPSHHDYPYYYNPRNCHSWGNQIYNNTIHGCVEGVRLYELAGENTIIRNNVFSGWTRGGVCFYQASNGTCKVLPTDIGIIADYNATSGNFAFQNIAGNDFHLLPGSSLINTGFNLGSLVTNDYDGISRPQGSVYDIGAYEYLSGGTPTVTPPFTHCIPLGDLDCSGKVNVLDLSTLLSAFGSTTNTLADLDNSGKVNMIDLSILLQNFGK